MSMLYRMWVGGVVGTYLLANVLGWRVSTAEHERIPPSVRSSPGGYRSFHFWHSGFSGGK
jgi:hypothetical protein